MSDRIVFAEPLQSRLNVNGWEAGFGQLQDLGINLVSRESNGISQERTIEIDLSRAAFADFSVLGRLLILAAALTRRGVKLIVRMPSDKIFPDEQEMFEPGEGQMAQTAKYRIVTRLQRQRMNCRLFLSQSGFESALKTGPLAGKVEIPPEDDERVLVGEAIASLATLDPTSQESYRAPQRLRRIIPYRWLDIVGVADGNQMPGLSEVEQTLAAIGMITYDATAVTQGIFRELIENVGRHSTQDTHTQVHALLGASLVQASAYRSRQQDFDEFIQPFTERASEFDAPILRLFVGDAGQGIKAASGYSHLPEAEAVAETILAALDYHPPVSQQATGPRGLWMVKELVRSFDGSVVAFSGKAVAGYELGLNERKINSNSTYLLPGTIIECNLLVGADGEAEPQIAGGSMYPSLTEKTLANLKCAAVLLRNGTGIDPADVQEITEIFESIEDRNTAGIAISVEVRPGGASPNEWDIQQAIRQIYDRLGTAAADTMVAIVFAGISWRLLALAVVDLNLQLDIVARSEATSFATSMLIITDDKRHYWVGGSPGLRKALYRLSRSGQAERFSTIENLLKADKERHLKDAGPALSHILRVESGMVQLAFHPSHVISAMTDYCAHNLAQAVVQQNPADQTGEIFITPSLREVGKWIDTRSALHAVRCMRMAGFLMAAGMEATLQRESLSVSRIQVIPLGSLEGELASTFTLSLTGREQEFTFEELAGMRTVPLDTGRQVVVCTNIISNGASIRRAVRELWHLGFVNVAVAAIIDARDLSRTVDGRTEDSGHLVIYDKTVPLFALTSVSVAAVEPKAGPSKPIFIDPVIRQPIPRTYPRSKTFMVQQSYVDAICRSGAARLGHIRRWSGRGHDAAYIDPAQLFADADWSKRAFQMMIKRICDDHSAAHCGSDAMSATCIIYPGEPNEDLAYAAQGLVDALRAQSPEVGSKEHVQSIPVPRAVMNGEWIFPRVLNFSEEVNHVVAIDSGSRTGSTLRSLIRLAAQPQIRCISVFSLINGMTDLESLSLQEIASVRPRPYDGDRVSTEVPIPVSVRYLVRTAAGARSGSCAQCAVRSEYAALQRMPTSLERHRDWLLKMLEPRSRQSVFADTPADFYGMSIEQEDCIEYLIWRSFLAEAAVDTESRLAVVNRITKLANDCLKPDMDGTLRRRRDALVRVLAAESDRLQVAPLWFTSVRSKIMKVLWSLVSAPTSYPVDQALRVQAVVVLSRGDVSGLSTKFAQLVRDSLDNDLVFRHVLVEAVRLVQSKSGLPEWSNALADQISILSQEVNMPSEPQSHWTKEQGADINFLADLTGDAHGPAS